MQTTTTSVTATEVIMNESSLDWKNVRSIEVEKLRSMGERREFFNKGEVVDGANGFSLDGVKNVDCSE